MAEKMEGKLALSGPQDALNGVALEKWSEITGPDGWAFGATGVKVEMAAEYCRLHARKELAEAKVAEFGELVASPNGFPVQSPWLQIVNKARADMLRIVKDHFSAPTQADQGVKAKRQAAAEEHAQSGGKYAPPPPPTLN